MTTQHERVAKAILLAIFGETVDITKDAETLAGDAATAAIDAMGTESDTEKGLTAIKRKLEGAIGERNHLRDEIFRLTKERDELGRNGIAWQKTAIEAQQELWDFRAQATSKIATLRAALLKAGEALEKLSLQPWEHCPSTHCERREECASPHECSGSGRSLARRALAEIQEIIK